MRPALLSAVCCLIFAGCAGLTPGDCRSADWYQIGQRDGRLGAQPQADLHAARCSAKPDTARYGEGWQAGFAARPIPNW